MPEKGGFMEEENNLSVNLRVLVTYFPEIVECLHTPKLGGKCTGCEFKDECRVVAVVGFLMNREIMGLSTGTSDTELIN
ncbi:hypothetical protein [Thermodesulfovibrio sp.]|jgi:hypothetical protein|uniref:Uncharacterized protein n=2 Tax=Thermodesulfovibrio TaxID=28261 RepID=A0A2J6WN82_9BACT|nr:MAG: hypothetical protein C0186_02695 [Thermodesulfovibrio aggregans]